MSNGDENKIEGTSPEHGEEEKRVPEDVEKLPEIEGKEEEEQPVLGSDETDKTNEMPEPKEEQPSGIDHYAKDKKIIAECEASGEPCFTLRAKDLLAEDTLTDYIEHCRNAGVSEEFMAELVSIQNRFGAWRIRNKGSVRIPN